MKGPTPLQHYEMQIQRDATGYRLSAFIGSGQYSKAKTVTFNDAIKLADTMHQTYSKRPVAIYAIRGNSHSHLVNFDPRRPITMAYLITYTVTGRSELFKFEITRYTDAAAARTALEGTPEGTSGVVVEMQEDLRSFSGPALAKIYNTLRPDNPVERFSTLDAGRRRVFEDLTSSNLPVLSVPVNPAATAPLGDVEKAVAQHHQENAMATTAAVKEKPARGGFARPVGKVSDLRPIRDDTGRANVLKLLDEGKHTADDIAKRLKINVGQLTGYIRWLSTIGIGTAVDDKGRLSAVYPGSKTIADVIVAKEV